MNEIIVIPLVRLLHDRCTSVQVHLILIANYHVFYMLIINPLFSFKLHSPCRMM